MNSLRPSFRPAMLALAPLVAALFACTLTRTAHAEPTRMAAGSAWGASEGVDPCASEDLLERQLALDPALRERREMFEQLVREAERQGLLSSTNKQRNSTSSSATSYVIPVVVHIVASAPNAIEDISDTQVLSQLYALNRDFANLPAHPAPAVNTNISFCLALGLPTNSTITFPATPGITRDYSAPLTNHVYGNPASEAALKALSYLPSTQYLNIWVVKTITAGVAGYATFPATVQPAVDGIVMRADCFGSNYTPYGSGYNLLASNPDGKILTHEAGHFLNLLHTFHGGCATPGDQVSDTPPEQVNRSGCPSTAPTSCTSAADPIENFMDYTNDACRFAFTAGQKMRMFTAIASYRTQLVGGAALVQAGCTAGLNAYIIATPSQLCAGGTVQFITPASGTGYTYAWSFPGGTPSSDTTQNPSVTYPTAGAWPVSLSVNDAYSHTNSNFSTVYVTACAPIQNQCTNWVFGSHTAVSFATGVPIAFNGTQGNGVEAATSISDASGNLRFYSDGDRVLDASNTVMPNGTGLLAGGSSHNGVIAVQRPGSTSQYYLFTVKMIEYAATTNLLNYSVVDMTLHAGLGDIPAGQKNLAISIPGNPDGMMEALALIPNCNGTDWWLITEGATGNVAKVFVTPVTSAGPGVTQAYTPSGGHGTAPGAIVPSADGTMFSTVANIGDVAIYNFNRATGSVSVSMPSTVIGAYYDAVLSPDKKLLYYGYYISSVFGVRQLNLTTMQTRELVTNQECVIRPGPDGKLYVGGGTASALHCINFPNQFNTNNQNECGLNLLCIPFPYPYSETLFGSLPNMPLACTGVNPPAQFEYTVSNCTTVNFHSVNCAGPYNWSFGDNTSGSGVSVSHTYAGPGTYSVTLTVPAASPTTSTQGVTLGMQPVTLAGANTACSNPNNYSAIGPANYTYHWSASGGTPPTATGSNVDITWLSTGGTLTLIATDSTSGCTTVVTKNVGACPSCTKPPLGMSAWWPLDEPTGPNAIETVLGSHGVDINAPSHVTGMVKRARQFNGVNNYVRANDTPGINFGTGNLTIDAWVRTLATTGIRSIVDKRFPDPEVGYAMYLKNGRLALRLSDPSNASGTEYWTSTTPYVADGQWHHVAGVEDRSDAATGSRLYVDGNLAANFPAFNPTGSVTTTEKLLIGAGASTTGPSTFFDGAIDEVELFQRALATSDILGIVQSDTLGKCKEFAWVPAYASLCRDQSDITLTLQVCNHTTATQTYNLVLTGLPTGGACTWPGPTAFQVLGPNPVTVPPNTCVPVSYKVFRPAGMPIYTTACYQVAMTNIASNYSTVAQGSITSARQWCFLTAALNKAAANISTGATLRFVLTNTSDGPLATPFTVRAMAAEPGLGESPAIAFGGVAPGLPYSGVANVGPGDSIAVEVFTRFTEPRPFRAYNIVLAADEDGDGTWDAQASAVLRYAADSIATLAVLVPRPAALTTSLSVAPNPTRDRTLLSFTLPVRGRVDIALYDIAGRRVQQVLAEVREAGAGSVVVDCSGLPRGMYLVRMRTGGAVAAQRLVMLK